MAAFRESPDEDLCPLAQHSVSNLKLGWGGGCAPLRVEVLAALAKPPLFERHPLHLQVSLCIYKERDLKKDRNKSLLQDCSCGYTLLLICNLINGFFVQQRIRGKQNYWIRLAFACSVFDGTASLILPETAK